MAETNVAFSKIVSTPTPTAWSQAYSAGKVFASISLESQEIPQDGEEHLSSVGKDLISTFESEFFTLEQKNLDTIKQALSATISRLKEGITLSMVLCYIEENVLYLFAVGGGKAILKRGDKIGTVLEGDEDSGSVKPASGYIQEEDIIVLETKPFLKIIPSSTLASSLEANVPEEIAEDLAPHVHERAEGGASSVILMYKKGEAAPVDIPDLTKEPQKETEETQTEEEVTPIEDTPDEEVPSGEESTQSREVTKENLEEELGPKESPFVTEDNFVTRRRQFRLPSFQGITGRIPKGRRSLLFIAGALILIIVLVSFLAINKNSTGQNNKLFTKVLAEAQTKYEEGQNLKDLNASLSQESFGQAKDILVKNEGKFKNDSSKSKQIQDLLSKVNAELKGGGGEKISAKEVEKDASQILSAEIDKSEGTFFSENQNNVVFLDKSGVNQVDKGNGEKSLIVKKDWTTSGGIGTFGSNIYVLDKADGILKFVPSEDTYSKTDYFVGDSPDLESSISMAIDGSVYILFKDGSIKKFTRGNADTFEISGLSKSISSNAKLFTNSDSDNLYVLDIPNSRIVVLGKGGEFKTSYAADIIKNAKDFDVKETDKKVFILANDKVYQIDLK